MFLNIRRDAVNDSAGEPPVSKPEIDWSSIDPNSIPVEIIKNHPMYKDVKEEAIKRRLAGKREAADPAPVPPKDPLLDRLEKLEAAQAESIKLAKNAQMSVWKNKAAEYGLKGRVLDTIQADNEADYLSAAKAIADELGVKPMVFQSGLTGQTPPVSQDIAKRLFQRVNDGSNISDSIFNAEDAKTIGGGVILDAFKEGNN